MRIGTRVSHRSNLLPWKRRYLHTVADATVCPAMFPLGFAPPAQEGSPLRPLVPPTILPCEGRSRARREWLLRVRPNSLVRAPHRGIPHLQGEETRRGWEVSEII